MSLIIGLIAFIGALLTVYLLHVEAMLLQNKGYKSVCDINDKISCTAVAKSKYSHIFGVSNAVLGILYYGLIAILSLFGDITLILYLSIPAVIMSSILWYILFFKIKKICLVCYATYVINFLILILSLLA